ncbi:hypothetical protein BDW22DRAFT_844430 [Trametopsis cervina]|nr:hypothetical protein BDW22DRAFT_844430 [Trametopsis cervina]
MKRRSDLSCLSLACMQVTAPGYELRGMQLGAWGSHILLNFSTCDSLVDRLYIRGGFSPNLVPRLRLTPKIRASRQGLTTTLVFVAEVYSALCLLGTLSSPATAKSRLLVLRYALLSVLSGLRVRRSIQGLLDGHVGVWFHPTLFSFAPRWISASVVIAPAFMEFFSNPSTRENTARGLVLRS